MLFAVYGTKVILQEFKLIMYFAVTTPRGKSN